MERKCVTVSAAIEMEAGAASVQSSSREPHENTPALTPAWPAGRWKALWSGLHVEREGAPVPTGVTLAGPSKSYLYPAKNVPTDFHFSI